ncbi:solute carrier organic anion transporter family member 1A2-like isoform X2 [Ascaphus truei]|uniref:solute carrier organic anion transporter family member 1A2-like isoform X2 n=1 Tax=Ascaphus truei TaxID=8439 RepID=UPI003F59E153
MKEQSVHQPTQLPIYPCAWQIKVTSVTECKSGSESLMWIFVLMGNILRGIGETPVEPLGLSYVDDFAKVENSPFYIGIIQTVSIIGPLLGSLMASYCAQLYVDIGFINLDDVTISLTDARWVGAWWSGYLISGIVNLLAAIPFWFLPKSLPKEGHEDQPDLEETMEPIRKENHEKKSPENNKDILKEFPRFLKNLFNNKVYLLYVIITVLQFNGFIGFISFLPKFVEQQYGKSASEAIFLIAVYSLPVICVGYFLGGFFMKKYKVTRYQAAKIGLLSSVLDYLTFMAAYAMICKNSSVAGLTISYEGIEEVSYLDHLKSGCNINCDCPTDVWDPVCGDNGVAYVSACLAGCQSSTGTWQNMTFQNCSCIAASSLSSNATAVLGQCAREENCDTMLLYFMILSLVCCFIYSSGAIPGYMVLIRSLKPEEKSLGLGLHLLAERAFAGITSPIYYGAIIDTTCIKWGTTSCGEPGACRMYDSDAFRYIYYGVTAALRGVSYIPCLLIMIILKREDRRNENSSSDKEAVEIKLEETSLNA